MWKKAVISVLVLAGCSDTATPIVDSDATEIASEDMTEQLVFSQDGDVFNVKSGEEFSVLLDLPAGTKDSTVLWLPEEGGFGPHLKIVRSYRSVEGSIYYTEHQFRGGEPGQLVVKFAPKNGPNPTHGERRTITFNIE